MAKNISICQRAKEVSILSFSSTPVLSIQVRKAKTKRMENIHLFRTRNYPSADVYTYPADTNEGSVKPNRILERVGFAPLSDIW